MIKLILTRYFYGDTYTLGALVFGDTFWFTLELGDRDNIPNASCIPEGEYVCKLVENRHVGTKVIPVTYEVMGVSGRSGILFHVGNTEFDTRGCILLGLGVSGKMLSNSRSAFGDFLDHLKGEEEFLLCVRS